MKGTTTLSNLKRPFCKTCLSIPLRGLNGSLNHLFFNLITIVWKIIKGRSAGCNIQVVRVIILPPWLRN
ncbi:hypothetical protein ES319_D06G110100v1 [Gossypium barbadense]|uniref:Uncharacterized protein n=1 Tax=Gossypium barbadense TaxID=3634 RepID=A0A5J5R3V8_GOSBA|nr:hypothetical protein ES319_D06G110100v1 [Gossypium barbadense]